MIPGAVRPAGRDCRNRPDLIDHGPLAAAFTADPMLPGMTGLLPSPCACAAFLLDVNERLAEYKVSLG
jgi:hypothetical protein